MDAKFEANMLVVFDIVSIPAAAASPADPVPLPMLMPIWSPDVQPLMLKSLKEHCYGPTVLRIAFEPCGRLGYKSLESLRFFATGSDGLGHFSV